MALQWHLLEGKLKCAVSGLVFLVNHDMFKSLRGGTSTSSEGTHLQTAPGQLRQLIGLCWSPRQLAEQPEMGTSTQLQALQRCLRPTLSPAQPQLCASGEVLQHLPAQLCLGAASGCLTLHAAPSPAPGWHVPALILRGPAGGSCCAPGQHARLATAQRASCARLTGAAVRRCPGAGAHTEDCRQDDTGLDPPFPF